uniref:Uncharacterized protein n=1 Tax=Arundo donax TaxID=35708 RepID=A0A0A9AWN0_ARUDO
MLDFLIDILMLCQYCHKSVSFFLCPRLIWRYFVQHTSTNLD